jgi:toxin ParE1/3/4
MSRAVVKKPSALADLCEAAVYLDEQTTGLGDCFLDASETAFEQLTETPGLGRLREFGSPTLKGLRSWRIRGFDNWLVFYRVADETVEIVRVLHGARDLDAAFDQDGDV